MTSFKSLTLLSSSYRKRSMSRSLRLENLRKGATWHTKLRIEGKYKNNLLEIECHSADCVTPAAVPCTHVYRFRDPQSKGIILVGWTTISFWEGPYCRVLGLFRWYICSIYLFININQLEALNFIISLFQASTFFEHMCSSSGGQNCIIQSLVSSHLWVYKI